MASGLTGSTPSDIAGGPSMTRLTNRICSAVNGAPPAIPVIEATRKVMTKPPLRSGVTGMGGPASTRKKAEAMAALPGTGVVQPQAMRCVSRV